MGLAVDHCCLSSGPGELTFQEKVKYWNIHPLGLLDAHLRSQEDDTVHTFESATGKLGSEENLDGGHNLSQFPVYRRGTREPSAGSIIVHSTPNDSILTYRRRTSKLRAKRPFAINLGN